MFLRAIAVVIWRVIGYVFVIYGIVSAVVQLGIMSGTFGLIMDIEPLYEGVKFFTMFMWPIVLIIAGLIIVLASRRLSGLVTRGLYDSNDR